MRRRVIRALCVALGLTTTPTFAHPFDVRGVVEDHIIPGYEALAETTAALALTAQSACAPGDTALETAYHAAFDAWVRMSHVRFGPSEQEDRAFALAFWPDPRGSTPKTLAALLREEDDSVHDPETFATISIAGRGFYALEFLLFDPSTAPGDNATYHCALVRAVTTDIARNATEILATWEDDYGALMISADNDIYQSPDEAAKQLFTALTTGLEFTSAARLGRPMGTFERPRPKRAEAWRSGRSLRHVMLSLESTAVMAARMTDGDVDLEHAFSVAQARAEQLDDPTFANVSSTQGRFRLEVLQQKIDLVRQHLAEVVGPSLGIAAGFNSLDGD